MVSIRDVVGVHGPHLAWLLAAFGIAGLVSMAVMARPLDQWPRASVVGCLGALAAESAVRVVVALTCVAVTPEVFSVPPAISGK